MKRVTTLMLAAVALAACGDSDRPVSPLAPKAVPSAAIAVTPSSTGAMVDTDKDDYLPGDAVTITGKGWTPGEAVHLNLAETPLADGPHDWDVIADANGDFTDQSFTPGTQHLGVTFTLTATGATSGTSQAIFTDGNIRVLSSGPSASVSWHRYSNTSCQAPPALNGSLTATTSGATLAANNGESVQFTVTVPAGFTFTGWTVASNLSTNPASPNLTSTTLCVLGFNGSSTRDITANFAVATVATTLTLAAPAPASVLKGSTGPVSLSATLTRTTGGAVVAGATVEFFVDAASVGTAVTTSTGVATLTTYNPAALAVGSHPIQATFAAATVSGTSYGASTASGQSLSVSDADGPVITATVTGTLGNNGWYTSNVAVSWSVTDGDSPVTSQSAGCTATTISTDTNGQTITCTATSAGGQSSNQVTIKRDATAPTASAGRSPAANADGWNNSDVTVTFSGTDATSGIASCDAAVVKSAEGAGQSASGKCTDNAGNASATASATGINIDKTAPTIGGAATTSPNGAGWYNADVTVHYTCSDALSGVATCSSDALLSVEGASLSASGTATDKAGNSATATVSGIKLDKTAPTVTANVTPAPNGHGWNNSAVTVSFDAAAGDLSGIATCTPDATLTAETSTSGQTAQGTCTDNAGNQSNTASATVKIDKTAPTIGGAAATSPNAAGWYKDNVAVNFTCADALSGIDTCGPNQTLTTEGTNLSATGTAVDNASNSATATVSGIKLDKTAPTSTVTGVTNNATYTLGSVPTAGCSASDNLSGVASNGTATATGGPVGSVTVRCNGAADNAGNTQTVASASVTYNVIYAWSGFFQPVDNAPTVNAVKAGSGIPVKFSLGGNQGLNIFVAGYPLTSGQIPCGTTVDDIETTVTAGNSSLTYDATANQYVYVWKTDKTWVGTCRSLTVKLIDGTTHQATFQFK